MKKRIVLLTLVLSAALLTGCGGKESTQKPESIVETTPSSAAKQADTEKANAELPDGVYTAEFKTDSSMFHVNEACDGKGTLTVKDGKMTIHVSLVSKNIVKLYLGLAKDAVKEGAELLLPTEDKVTYSDGTKEEVYGFDVPVPVLGEEFELALVGTKETWYDHKVSVSNPTPAKKDGAKDAVSLEDGNYSMEITFEGGSGKAKILSPVTVTVSDGKATAEVKWSSPYYDYMIVDGEKYLPTNTEGDSVFEIPVSKFDEPIEIIGDTVAMSKAHEVEYTITFDSKSAAVNKKSNSETTLIYERSMELQFAENFNADYYKGGYVLLTTTVDNAQILIVPEGREVPQDVEENVVVLQRPVKDLYLVASSVMDIFSGLNGLDSISFSGQKEDGWSIEAAKEAMHRGEMFYAGKYNKPDYELLVSNHCTFAIENTMITHSPEVVENLKSFGIPSMIDYSSYESHPLGRVEWVKFYGALLGKEEEAEKIFANQTAIFERVSAEERTDKTAAFFFITSNGLVQVRQSADYVPKMIELAGGNYIFENLGDSDTKRSTLNMQVEEFYAGAKDADFLIYNSSIDGGVHSIGELLDKCSLLGDFKAVKEGNVWCTTNDMYQQSLSVGSLMDEIHAMFQGEKNDMRHLYRLR